MCFGLCIGDTTMQVKIIEINDETSSSFNSWFYETQRKLWTVGLQNVALGKYDQHSATVHLWLLRTTISGNLYIIEWDNVDARSDAVAEYAKRIFYDAVQMCQEEEAPEIADTVDWMVAEYKELATDLEIGVENGQDI